MIRKGAVIILAVAAIFYLTQGVLSAERPRRPVAPPDVAQLEPITKDDRVLIFAPHPDDETLGAAGVIQKAVKAEAQVKVAYLTNGEHNQLAFIVFEKRLVIKQKALIQMGEMRQKEALTAMGLLGVGEENLIFLGYPDFGMLAIFLRYWGEVKPFKNMLTRISSVPYKNALTPNALYKGESVLWDVEAVLRNYKPTKIFVTNPVDTNGDHRAMYLFLQVALWDLEGQIPSPKVYPYLVHCYGWPNPRNYHPELYLDIPQLLEKSPMTWKAVYLSDEEMEAKQKAIRLYRSQCSDSAFYLTAFARKNELFCGYPVIELEKGQTQDSFKIATTFRGRTVVYGRTKGKFLINIFIKADSSEPRRFYINIAGYRRGVEFARMPKLKIKVNEDGVKALNLGQFVKSEKIQVEHKQHSVMLSMPFELLGNPDYILASVNTYTGNFPSDLNAWRVIKITQE